MGWIEDYQKKISYLKTKDFLASFGSTECFLITDKNLERYYGEDLFSNLSYFSIEPGEQAKTLYQVNVILERLLVLNFSRQVIIIGFGGGIVCDIAGFVSAIYKRGCRLALLPTSLIGMVDASIGGKNGVNSLNFKNQFGTFKQADYINIDFDLLETLPLCEIANGRAEIIKHGLIYSPVYYQKVRDYILAFDNNVNSQLRKIIMESIKIKLSFVAGDENDRGQRRFLNFGHTLGHVMEKNQHIPHGKAVIWGMIQALKLSYHLNLITEQLCKELLIDLFRENTVDQERVNWPDISEALLSDKKRVGEKITFILLSGLGKPLIKDIDLDVIKQVVMSDDENILRNG